MKLVFASFLLVITPFIVGCKTLYPMKLNAMADNKQGEFLYAGKETVSSHKTHYVSVAPYRGVCSATGKTSYVIFVQNLGASDIDFSLQNVSIEFQENSGIELSKSIPLQSYDDLLGEIEVKERNQKNAFSWAAVGAVNVISSVVNFVVNDKDKQKDTAKTNVALLDQAQDKTYSPELVKKNDKTFRHNLDKFASQSNSKKEMLNSVFITSQTISPGQYFGGLVVSDTREMNHKDEGVFKMKVLVDGEEHIFSVARSQHKPERSRIGEQQPTLASRNL